RIDSGWSLATSTTTSPSVTESFEENARRAALTGPRPAAFTTGPKADAPAGLIGSPGRGPFPPRSPSPCGTALRTGLLCGSTGQAGGRRTVRPGRRYARPKDARADALRLLWPHARREEEPGDRGHHRGGLEPGKGVFPSYRAHQARPGPLLPGRGRRRAARRGRAAERAQTVRERRWGRAVLPEARPGQAPRLDRDGAAQLPVRAERRGGRPPRRGRAGLDGEPGVHRPEPAPGPGRGPGPSRRAAGRPGPGARRGVAADPPGGPGRPRCAHGFRTHRVAQDVRVARLPHLRQD